jgi:hypothetical protein
MGLAKKQQSNSRIQPLPEESVGIMVDPANKTLKRLPAIPLK